MSLRVVLGGRCGMQAGRVLEFPAAELAAAAGASVFEGLSLDELVGAMRASWPADAANGIDFDEVAPTLLHSGRMLPTSGPMGLQAPATGETAHLHLVFRSKEHIAEAAAEKQRAEDQKGRQQKSQHAAPARRGQQDRRVSQDEGGCCVVA